MSTTATRGLSIRKEDDLQRCGELWSSLVEPEFLTDLWEFRLCFYRQYTPELFFLVVEGPSGVAGFLPLCRHRDSLTLVYFPGELWHGRTWIEQNRILAGDADILEMMLAWIRERGLEVDMRYLLNDHRLNFTADDIDEIGYLFKPPAVQFSMDEYHRLFSRKSLKSILKDVSRLKALGIEMRFDDFGDFDIMVQMNLQRFGNESYFSDNRFRTGLRAAAEYLKSKGWLRMVTVLLEGREAAVDLGCEYNGVYTLLAGGTHAGYPGVAKVINLYHMELSCSKRYDAVDFLCGDFSWKKIFQLDERPLYRLSSAGRSGI